MGYKNNIPYCRKCVLLTRGAKAIIKEYKNKETIRAKITYALTKTQSKASDEILEYVKNNQSVIVNAVCGAGKTELVYQSIEYFLNTGKRVAFAIPRKDVVIEIYLRLKNDYPNISICCVYGGHTNILEAQLVVLTTHQLYRYKSYFDLLILDEADAFPYYNNSYLSIFLNDSVVGPIIYLSATIKDTYKQICNNIVYVNRRFHNKDLPVPEVIKYNFINKIKVLKNIINKLKRKQILIFVPTISIGKKLTNKTKLPFVYSSSNLKQKLIDDFKNKNIQTLITTSILERGVTFFDVQVIVYEANHKLFDESSLIQISGRVGRKKDAPYGKVYFLSNKISEAMKKCIKTIKNQNKTVV